MKLDVDGIAIAANTGGRPFDAARPTVIFIHGAGMAATYWQLQSRWFAWHGWSVLAPDLPGHGRSGGAPLATIADMATWLGRLMDAAGVETVALVGHSMGGAIALEAAAAMPARVSHLVLAGSAGDIPVAPPLLEAARKQPHAAYDMMVGWGHGPMARIGTNPVPGMWMTGGAAALLERNRDGVLATDLTACNAWTTGDEAALRVNCPSLIIMGAQDVMTPPRQALALAGRIRSATTVTIPGCGHMMLQEAPDAVLDALIGKLGAR